MYPACEVSDPEEPLRVNVLPIEHERTVDMSQANRCHIHAGAGNDAVLDRDILVMVSYCSLAYSALACFRMGMSLGITNQHYVTAVSTPAHEKALAIGGQREIVDRFVMEMGDLCRGASFDWLAPQVRETGVGLVE